MLTELRWILVSWPLVAVSLPLPALIKHIAFLATTVKEPTVVAGGPGLLAVGANWVILCRGCL